MMDMSKRLTQALISKFLESHNVPLVGFTKPRRDKTLEALIENHKKCGQYIYFGDVTIEQRQNFEAVFPVCKEIIVIGVPYNSRNNQAIIEGEPGDGFISNMAWEYDYHHVIREKLKLLDTYIKDHNPNIETLIQVDTGPLIDRHIAYQSGLGSYAKNQGLMNEAYGTEFYIGYLLVNQYISLDVEQESPSLPLITSRCEGCNLCVKACPASALMSNYDFLGQRCISYLTQKKGYLTWEERHLMGTYIYGCDMCQLVCPYNNNEIPLAYRRRSLNRIGLKKILEMSNKQMVKTYKHTGFIWRGAKVLKRNAIIGIGNKGQTEDVVFLEALLESSTAYFVPYLLWALYRCGDDKIIERCEVFSKKFNDEIIKNECQMILQLIK
jgi:epoxyqueuosine reductase